MSTLRSSALHAAFAAVLTMALPSHASDDAALDLKPDAEPAVQAAQRQPLRAFIEVSAGRLSRRDGSGHADARRASLDLTWNTNLGAQWRAVLSNRLDDIHPVEQGERSTLNSLREVFAGWQSVDSRHAVELGRVNLRHGPAYGFNPTDYFREGSVRAVTTADPLALRENRLGTAMIRGQWLWQGGALSLALAPKLREAPSRESFSSDLGATNGANRGLLSLSMQAGESLSAQAFAYHVRNRGLQLGANGTALIGQATVGFLEWSGGRDAELLSAAIGPVSRVVTRHRAVAGVTHTFEGNVAVTAELQYNGFALDRTEWRQASSRYGAEAMGAYLYEVQRRQDIASRRGMMLYASKKDALVKNLELTGLVRYNIDDRSRFLWTEARYHFQRVDLALQWQANLGRGSSEYGSATGRSLAQLMAAFYF